MKSIQNQIKLESDHNDASQFISLIETIVNQIINNHDIVDLTIIKIKNWFDYKWLNYSGKGIIHFEETLHPEKVALTNFWKENITVPPFNPKRVLSEICYRSNNSEKRGKQNHLHKIQKSTKNHNNRINSKSENGLFVWYSSNSKANQQGSMMVYSVENKSVETWYASIENKNGWTITKTKGTDLNKLKELIM